MKDILEYFTKPEIRSSQKDILKLVQTVWEDHDVISIHAPTATGKTAIAETIQRWALANGKAKKVNILAPENVLIDQYEEECPDLAVLRKSGAYKCHTQKSKMCGAITRNARCRNCVYTTAKNNAVKADTRIMNYHVYSSNKIKADVLIFDEAHKLPGVIYSFFDLKLWHHEYKFPKTMKTLEDVVVWLQKALSVRPGNSKLNEVYKYITSIQNGAVPVYEQALYRGEFLDVLTIRRLSIAGEGHKMWPIGTKKIILMSATLADSDLKELGLDKKRCYTIKVDSEIPAANRQIIVEPRFSLAYSTLDAALPLLLESINELLDKHSEKGLIHLPYGIAEKVRPNLNNARLLWHNKGNKKEVLSRFKASDEVEGKVLIASGLYMGVDLPYDMARWQLIGKIPFPSLGDPFIKRKMEQDGSWYAWQTIKLILQAAGRIVRAPTDYGVTYIFDSNFGRLYRDNPKLFPPFFKNSVRLQPRNTRL